MIINSEYIEDPAIERIKLVQKKYSTGQADFARKINVPKSTLSSMYTRGLKVSFTILEAILSEFADVSADWLLRGIGEMELMAEPEPKVIVTDANEYLVKRFEEVIHELRDIKAEVEKKENLIRVMSQELEILRSEKKELPGSYLAAQPSSELKKTENV